MPDDGTRTRVQRTDRAADRGRVEIDVGLLEIDPLVDPQQVAESSSNSTSPSAARTTAGIGTPAARTAS